jgi:hypothetical protein
MNVGGAVIDRDTGVDPLEQPTRLEANARMSVI